MLGGLLPAGLLSWAFCPHSTNAGPEGTGTPAQHALLLVCYVPLPAWPPPLIAVAVVYYRRRTAAPPPAGDARGQAPTAREIRA